MSKRFPWFLRFAAMAAVLLLSSYRSYSQANNGPCVQTGLETLQADKQAYEPFETVRVAGSGFASDCQASLQLFQPDGTIARDAVTTDSQGSVSYSLSAGWMGGSYGLALFGQDGDFLAGAAYATGSSIQADKGDYHPGETATITGHGWWPGETVSLTFREVEPAVHTDRTATATADSGGSFTSTDLVFEAHDLGVTFVATATGQSSELTAETTFIDGVVFVQTFATATRPAVSTFITLTPTASVAAGHSVIIGIGGMASFAGAIGCTDTKSNTYTADFLSAAGTARYGVFSSHNIAALTTADTITCTYPSNSSNTVVASANEFQGLLAPPLDKFKGATSTNAGFASTGNVTTTAADELLFGFFLINNSGAQTFTATAPYSVVGSVSAGGTQPRGFPMYKTVAATGTYDASGTVTGSGGWKGAIATYKLGAACSAPAAAAGLDQNVCATTATLAGNDPAPGTGAWTLVSGSGSVTTLASPTSGVTALGIGDNVFQWTVSEGTCPTTSDTVTIHRDATPTTADAGPAQEVCATSATLAANNPTVGQGTWSVVSGAGTFSDVHAYNAAVSGLSAGANSFRWTIHNGTCTDTTSDVTITSVEQPSTSAAGSPQQVCATSATLAANDPYVGQGTWSVVSGAGTFSNVHAYNAAVSGLSVGANTFRWTIHNGICTDSTSNVTITRDEQPTTALAGANQQFCETTSTTITGNTPAVGTGKWSLVSGAGTVTSPDSATTTVTGLGYGINAFRWTISNGTCAASTSDVAIRRDQTPTASLAGPDQVVGGTSAALAANTPAVGQGTWSVVSGTGTFGNVNDPSTTVSGLTTTAVNTFRWTIGNGSCASSSDDVNIYTDSNGDGIPDSLACTGLFINRVVDPAGVLAAFLPANRRHATLQAAVTASVDNDVVAMYASTTENVIIGNTTGSGGRDLRIVGCGHKVTAADLLKPVLTAEVSAGANDGDTGAGEMDIHVEDVSVLKGSMGLLIQTSKASTNNTSTLLKSIRSDNNGPSNGAGAATVANPGIGIKIEGNGNEVRGANSVGTNSGDGIQVIGNGNLLNTNRLTSNRGDGIDVTGNANTIVANKAGEKSLGNKGNGITVAGAGNTVNENDVFASTLLGIKITGNMNLVYKNDVGEDGKGNLAGGILITGDNNLLGKAANENGVYENGGVGIGIVGNNNNLSKNSVGDKDKGNTGDGINVRGFGNVLDQNSVFANGGDGIDLAGGTLAKPNVISNNAIGDKGKGNLANGILVGAAADAGNGTANAVEIDSNTVKANKMNGIKVSTASHQLANNVVGGAGTYASGGQDNGQCEFTIVASNFNTGGNTANGTAVPGAMNSAFPTTCIGTP